MNLANVQTGLLVGLFILLFVLAVRSPVGRYEIANVGGGKVFRADTKTGVIVQCELVDEEAFEVLCGKELDALYKKLLKKE